MKNTTIKFALMYSVMLSRPQLRTTLLRTGCALAVGMLAMLGTSAALAQLTYWNGAGTTSLVGGSGTWNAGNGNWTTNPYSSNTPWPGGTNTAIFGNTAGTVTLANGFNASIGGLTFNQTGYTLGATGTGSLALSNSTNTFTTGANVNATISAPITGGSGNALVINGGSGSTLTLTSTANNYSGGTIINSGSVVVNNAAPCSAGFIFLGTGPVTLNAGASLFNGGNECAFKFMGPLTISGSVTVPTNSVTPFPVMTLSGGTIGSVNSTPTGDGAKYGTVAIDNSVTVTANSSINAFGAIWSQVGGPQLTVNSGVTLTIGGTFVHTLNGDNGFNLLGGGTIVFTNDGNNYWGQTTVSVGTLVLGNGGTSGNLTDTTTGVSLGNSGTLKFNRSNNFTFGKSISGTGNVWQAGSGTTTLSAANTYTGATTVDAGRLQLAYAGGNTLAGNGAITVNSGGTLGLGGLSQALTTGGSLTVNAGGTLDLGASGTLLLGSGSTASIANITGSGTITVNSGGTLTLTGAIGNSNVNIVLAGGTLNLGNFAHSLGTLTQTAASTVNFTPASSLRVANMGTPFTGALAANGWIAGNSHFYATAINGNPAATGATGATGVVPLNQIALGSNTGSTTYWVNTGEMLSTNLSYNFWNGNAGNTSLVGGSGTWNSASTNWTSNPYTSNNLWAGGANIAIFGGTGGTVTVDTNYSASVGGIFFNVGGYAIVPSTATSTIALAAATNTITTGAGLNATISAPITGGAGNALATAGGGTLTLAAANTYIGATNVTAGTLALGIANAIPTVSAVTVAPGATLNLAGLGQTLSAGLSSSGNLALGTGSTLTLSGGSSTIAAVTGSGTIKVSTGATLTLTAALANSNVNIILDGGTLNLGNFTHSLGTLTQSKSSTLNFTSGSNLTVANIGSTFTGTLSATGWVMGGSHFYATAISGNPAKGTTGAPPLSQIALGANAASATIWSNASANPNEIQVNNATFNLWNAAQDLGATYGGTGTWNGANSNWATYPGGANGTWAGAANTAIFGGTAGTVTLADGYNASIGGLIFNASGTSIVPAALGTGTLALAAANNTVTTGAGVNAKISTIITGGSGNGLVIAGGGTLTITNAANSYAGGTTVQSGTLIVASNTPCGSSNKLLGTGALTINAGATVSSTGTSQCWFATANKINVNPNGVLVLQIDTVSGLAPVILNGGTIVTAGTVPIGTAATWGTAAFNNSVTVTADSTINAWGAILSQPGGPQFTVNSGVTLTMAGTIVKSANGDYGFTLLGGGTMVFTNDGNNYWSQTTVTAGTLALGNGGTGGNLTDTQKGISLGSLGNLQFNRSNAFTFAKAISGAGNVAQVGSGTTTLTGANTYTGTTRINAGTLALGVANALPAASAVTVAPGATLNLAGFGQSLSAGLTSNGTLALGTGSTLTLSGGSSILAAITGSGTITVNAGATLTLTGAISNSNVNIVLAGGTLNLGNFTHSLGTLTQTTAASTLNFTSVSNLTVSNIAGIANGISATGWLAGGSHFYATAISGNPAKNTPNVPPLNLITLGTNIPSATKWSSSNSEILAASSAFTLWNANGDGTSYGGNGTWNVSNTNWATYPAQSGSTATWAGGSNIAIFDGAAGTVKIADGYNASVGGLTFNVNGYSIAPTTPSASGTLLMPAATNSITSGQGVSATIGVPIAGAGSALNIAVGSTLTLSAQANPTTISTYTGGTTVQSGTVVLNNGTQTCANGKSLLGYGPLTIHAGASVIGAGMDNALGCNASFPGGGVSQVTVNANGTLTLPSDYITILPALTLNGGTIATANNPVGGNAAQWGTANFRSAVAVTANSTIQTIGACNNQIQAGGTQYTVGTGVTLTMAGTFVDTDPANNNSGFTLLGGGTMVFTNDGNSYTPTTTVSAGTLVLGNGGTSGNLTATSGVSLGSSGTLQFNRSDAFTFSRPISGNGKVAQVGSGTATLSANNTYTGTTTLNAGALNITGSNTSPITVNSGATLTGTGSTTGSVTVNSGGTLTPAAPSGSTTTLTVGATTLATGSTFNSSLGATDTAPKSLLAVTGNLKLGGTLNVTANASALSGRYTVATYTGTLSGSFDAVNLPSGYSAKVDTSTTGLVQLVPNTVLTKQFAAGTLPVGGAVGLTFTLVNPTGGGASSGMGFTDTMSAGLLVGSGTISNTCGATVTATPGSNTVTVSGATVPAAAGNSASSCSIVVPITTSATPVLGTCAAANTTGQSNISAVSGIDTSVSMASTCVPVSAGLVSGTVFNDGGVGSGGAANDGIRNGAEAGMAGVAVALTNCAGTTYASATTDGSGAYNLAPPATLAVNSGVCVAISPSAGPIATGGSVGSTVTPNASVTNVVGVNYTYTRAANQQSFNLPLSGVAGLNFGLVPTSTFGNNSQLSGSAGSTVRHKHQFVAGSAGTVTFSVSNSVASLAVSGWGEKLFRNASCDGVLSGSDVASPLTSVAVTQGQVVCVVLEEFVPAGASGSRTVVLQAAFTLINANPALSASFTVQDITLAGSSAIVINKQVRNVTTGGSFGLNNQAKPGDVLEYQLSYANNSDKQVTNVVVNDTTPAYTTFVSATEGATPAGLSNCRKNTPANPLPGASAVPCGTVQSAGGAGAIRWVFDGALLPGATGTVLYQVQVAP